MAGSNLIKEYLFALKKQLIQSSSIWSRKIKRTFAGQGPVTLQNTFNIPIIINNFNRYTYLLQLIAWLESKGYTHLIILDNNSTYTPLLNYYATTKHRVIFLRKNVGYKALWETEVFKEFENKYYVYTDPDLLPGENCPADIVYRLYEVLSKYKQIEKCGPALTINNLPEHYNKKTDVLQWEAKHWQHPVEKDVYDAPVDTTFALYKPFAKGEAEKCKAYRLAGQYCFLHLPWYEDSANPGSEELFYKNSIDKKQSHWVK